MDQQIKNKVEEIIKSAKSSDSSRATVEQTSQTRPQYDSLSTVIRTKEDADRFMAKIDALCSPSK